MTPRFPLALPNLKDPETINRLLALLCFIYILSPLLYFVPASDFEDRVIWTAWEGLNWTDGPMARRAFVQVILVFFANTLHVSPWVIWQVFLTVLAPLSVWLTYLFVRHFRPVGPLEFALFTLAVPYWVIHIQYPSDTTFAYPAVIASLYLTTKNRWWLPLAAVLALLAFKLRPDALPMAGVAALTIWVDRKFIRDKIIDCTIFSSVFLLAFVLLLGYFNLTIAGFFGSAMSTVHIDWPESFLGMDTILKVFTVNTLLVLPFYLQKIYRDFCEGGPVIALWVLVPIAIYAYLYRNLMVEPRWFTYVAPFVLLVLIDGGTLAIAYLKKFRLFRRRYTIAALIGILLFNPFLHITSLDATEGKNIVKRLSKANDRILFSYLHTGLLPALNLVYKANYYPCYTYTDWVVKEFLASPYSASVIFIIGSDGENIVHHRILDSFYSHFGIPYAPDTVGKNLAVQRRTYLMEYRYGGEKSKPGQSIERFTYRGKTLILVKNRGPLFANNDLPIVEIGTLDTYLNHAENRDPKFTPNDLFKAVSILISIPQYPQYLDKKSYCLINDRSAEVIPRVAAAAEATAKAKLQTPEAQRQKRYLNRQKILLQKNKEAHERWLADNPEYEKRLYDRVKDINKRTVKLTRYLILGFIAVLIVLSLVVVIVVRRWSLHTVIGLLSARQPAEGEAPTPTKASSEDLFGRFRLKIQLASIARRQNRLEEMCNRIEDRLQTSGDEKESLEALFKQIREELQEIAREREAVSPPSSQT